MSRQTPPLDASARTRPAEPVAFGDVIKRFDAPDGDGTHALTEAVGIWIGYALCSEAIECLPDSTADEKYKLRNDLNSAHIEATFCLMKAACREGLNPSPLSEAGRVCRELFQPIRGQGSVTSSPIVVWFQHPNRTADTWPECLGEWRYALPPEMQLIIRQGAEVLMQLITRHAIAPADSTHIRNAITQGEGGIAPADPYADLRRFARASLKGKERAVIDALCDAGGELAISDLALREGVDWGGESFQGFKNAQTRLSRKLKKIGWTLARRDNSALLRQTGRLERGLK